MTSGSYVYQHLRKMFVIIIVKSHIFVRIAGRSHMFVSIAIRTPLFAITISLCHHCGSHMFVGRSCISSSLQVDLTFLSDLSDPAAGISH